MVVDFFCPRWGSEHLDWETFLTKVKNAGYAGIEWFPYGENSDPERVVELLKKHQLKFSIVTTVLENFSNFETYLSALEKQLSDLGRIGAGIQSPLFISAQVGREYFNKTQVDACLECCTKVSQQTNIPVYQETHRNKWAYAVHIVGDALLRHPNLNLTLDASHWFCVSESYLEDQQPAVALAIERARHVHARVGYTQGSQVPDPSWPEYATALEAHLKIWDKWIERNRAAGLTSCTISPEFGPAPYLIQINKNITAHEQQWNLNLWMKDLLHKRYNG
jgi:hypothetical protein